MRRQESGGDGGAGEKKGRGRPKGRWLDSIRSDLSEIKFSVDDAQDRHKWRRLTRHIDPT